MVFHHVSPLPGFWLPDASRLVACGLLVRVHTFRENTLLGQLGPLGTGAGSTKRYKAAQRRKEEVGVEDRDQARQGMKDDTSAHEIKTIQKNSF